MKLSSRASSLAASKRSRLYLVRLRPGVISAKRLPVNSPGTLPSKSTMRSMSPGSMLRAHTFKEDQRIDRGFMNVWARSIEPGDIDRMVDLLGNVPGEFTSNLFALMTPGRSLTKYNLDLLDAASDDARLLNFMRMEKWLADRPDQPGEFARQWLKELYQENKLVRGEFVLDGRRVEVGRVRMPVRNILTDTDHVIPPPMSPALKQHVGTKDDTPLVVKGGHIGILVGARSHAELGAMITQRLAER